MNNSEQQNNGIVSLALLNENEWEKLLIDSTNEERLAYLTKLLQDIQNLCNSDEKLNGYRLVNYIRKKYSLPVYDSVLMLMDLATIGLEAYQTGDLKSAEISFAIMCDFDDSNGRNNYAYMIRRGEISEESGKDKFDAMNYLRPGLIKNEPFSIVNMALVFALNCGSDDDWHIADDLFDILSESDVYGVKNWWENVGKQGDVEGYLVHFFLLYHKKIKNSVFGSVERLSKKLSEEFKTFPEWLIIQPRFESLNDVFETMLDDDFEDNLAEYLNNMPRNRKSAEEILEEMTQWDEWELYKTLLQDYKSFLSSAEIAKAIQSYKKKFSMIPLSTVIDESILDGMCDSSSEE